MTFNKIIVPLSSISLIYSSSMDPCPNHRWAPAQSDPQTNKEYKAFKSAFNKEYAAFKSRFKL